VSRIVWGCVLVPPPEAAPATDVYDFHQRAELHGARRFPERDEELVELPDPRTYRSLSRAALLLAASGVQARPALGPHLARDPFRVGIYCATEPGPNDYVCARKMTDTPPGEFAEVYRSLRAPTQYLKQLANVAPAQLAILLGATGPLSVFTHSRQAGFQALEAADHDLENGHVDAALACSAFALEDALVNLRARRGRPEEVVISEASVSVVLLADGLRKDWRSLSQPEQGIFYGIADVLVSIAKRRPLDVRSADVR